MIKHLLNRFFTHINFPIDKFGQHTRIVFFLSFLIGISFFKAQTISINSISTLREPSGETGYTLDGLHMVNSAREKLLDIFNFSPIGIYPKKVVIDDWYS